MKLIHITGVLQTAPYDGIHAYIKCLVSNCSEMNVVTYWPSFLEFGKFIFHPGEMPSLATLQTMCSSLFGFPEF